MLQPNNPSEFRCMVLKLIDEGAFDPLERDVLKDALEEVIGSIVDNFINGTQVQGSVRIVGQILVRALAHKLEMNVTDTDRCYTLAEPGSDSVV